ncbi:MAG: HD domain-containing protein [Prevotella sp.]|nr:HD domain-containing protein [Prevotella sp.]
MIKNTASLDLVEFIETQILPQYANFDSAHNLVHVTRVIKRAMELARQTGADMNMVYTIAAYHDLGMAGPRAVHHITGGKILATDARLKRWFSAEQINIMKEAVEDHRASASRAPRSLYGKIVAEADRDIVPEVVFQRTIQYGLANYPDMDKEQHWQRFKEHMDRKYSSEGYIRLWIPGSPNEEKLKELRRIIADEHLLRQHFDHLYQQESVASGFPAGKA